MRAGPKGTVTADPLDSSSYSTGRAKRRGRFSGDYLVTPRRQRAGKPFKLRPFQREIMRQPSRPVSGPRGSASRAPTA
jgi:hypothetical protein